VGTNNQMREWVAHVKIDGKILEITVWDTSRQMAVDQAYRRFGLSGPEDPRIQMFRCGPAEFFRETKKKATPVEVPEIPKRDKSKDKRFRVRMYPSPMSRDLKQITLQTIDAQNALWHVMYMFGIKRETDLGPYIVEEERASGRVTLMYNQIHTFKDRGPLELVGDGYDPAPKQTLPNSGYNEQVVNSDDLDRRHDAALAELWDDAMDARLGPRKPTADTFIAKVNNIFEKEKKAVRPNVKIVKR
jgi:hypothetical protein